MKLAIRRPERSVPPPGALPMIMVTCLPAKDIGSCACAAESPINKAVATRAIGRIFLPLIALARRGLFHFLTFISQYDNRLRSRSRRQLRRHIGRKIDEKDGARDQRAGGREGRL